MTEIRVYQMSGKQISEHENATIYYSSGFSSRKNSDAHVKKINPRILLDNRTTMEESPVALRDGHFSSCGFSRETHFRDCIA